MNGDTVTYRVVRCLLLPVLTSKKSRGINESEPKYSLLNLCVPKELGCEREEDIEDSVTNLHGRAEDYGYVLKGHLVLSLLENRERA